jgi:branched-subunit amino acid transport protein
MTIWMIILSSALLVYAIRVSGILLLSKRTIPPTLQRGLQFVPVTVLPAIIAQELCIQQGAPAIALDNPRLLAGVIAIMIAWRLKNTILTIVAGMAVLFILQAFLG